MFLFVRGFLAKLDFESGNMQKRLFRITYESFFFFDFDTLDREVINNQSDKV